MRSFDSCGKGKENHSGLVKVMSQRMLLQERFQAHTGVVDEKG